MRSKNKYTILVTLVFIYEITISVFIHLLSLFDMPTSNSDAPNQQSMSQSQVNYQPGILIQEYDYSIT